MFYLDIKMYNQKKRAVFCRYVTLFYRYFQYIEQPINHSAYNSFKMITGVNINTTENIAKN